MKKITYTMKLLSSLIVSPRSGQAFYKNIDEFCLSPDDKLADIKSDKKHEIKVVYPFYQYGEYERYDPEHANYYLPGSSVKGALLQHKRKGFKLMADDVPVPNLSIVLRSLWKAQYLDDVGKAGFALFFDNVGIEMIKDGTELDGDLYLEENIAFSEILETANKDTKDKINQMRTYIQMLLVREFKNEDLKKYLHTIEEKLTALLKENNVILVGGYKGLLHSILLGHNRSELAGGLFIDPETLLPHGLVRVKEVISV
ncbi:MULTISPECIES: hypothetical protein [Clostridia]|uniref:hypothetical protein n=1 Tax=Clostridia TaxID=186801 RepID=UPI00067E9FA9|nr:MULTISPECIES: hypothetical protein [Clostridia]